MQKTFENLQTIFQNWCQNLQKTFKKLDAKKESIFRSSTRNPGSPRESHKHIQINKTHKASEERHIQRGTCRETNLDPSTRLGRLRARSGYIWTTPPPGFLGYPAGNCALEYPDSWPSHLLDLQAPIPDFQIHFSSFWVLFSAIFDFRLLSDLIFQLPSSIFFLFWELVGSILAQIFMKFPILS